MGPLHGRVPPGTRSFFQGAVHVGKVGTQTPFTSSKHARVITHRNRRQGNVKFYEYAIRFSSSRQLST